MTQFDIISITVSANLSYSQQQISNTTRASVSGSSDLSHTAHVSESGLVSHITPQYTDQQLNLQQKFWKILSCHGLEAAFSNHFLLKARLVRLANSESLWFACDVRVGTIEPWQFAVNQTTCIVMKLPSVNLITKWSKRVKKLLQWSSDWYLYHAIKQWRGLKTT